MRTLKSDLIRWSADWGSIMVERVKLRRRYDVGYRKPPRHTQFKNGCSGNPKGRPKGSKNFATIVDEELNETVIVVENGKRKRIPKMRAAVRQTLNGAMRGDFRALHQIVNLLRCHDALKRVGAKKPPIREITAEMTPSEAALLYQQSLQEDFEE
jgi:hypothetical protein